MVSKVMSSWISILSLSGSISVNTSNGSCFNAESLSAASAGPLDKKTIAERAVCEDLCKIRPLAGGSANVKRVSNEGP